ncbi:hypothetical protein BDZ97DRAFT_1751113 [Flammula alnicola]|nr:hypothetical protein BDZ97DRAFT_1751113 [Flammula alnicola]
MTSPITIKQEEQPSPLDLYTISRSGSPPQWSPTLDDRTIPKISTPQLSFPIAPPKSVQGSYAFHRHERHLPNSGSSRASPFTDNPAIARHTRVLSSSPAESSTTQRIARPPNAFMLFRSDFLKKGVIPGFVECRQQNLSRIAGQVWNLMDPVEKEKWSDRAQEVLKDHQQRFPDYKFTPAARGSRRTKSKMREDGSGMGEDEVRRIRETYTNVIGPSAASNRKRTQKKARSVEVANRFLPSIPRSTDTPFRVFTPPPSPSRYIQRIDQSPPLMPLHPMETFPQPSLPRRPSTSLGFNEYAKTVPTSFLEHINIQNDCTTPVDPGSANPSKGFFDYVRFRARDVFCPEPQQSGALDSSSSYPAPTFDTSLWTRVEPHAVSQHPAPAETNIQGLPPHQHPSASAPSTSMMPPSVPYGDQSSHFHTGSSSSDGVASFEPRNEDEHAAYLTSLGFDEELLLYLKPPYDNSTFSSGEPKVPVEGWLPGTGCLDNWDFGDLYTGNTEYIFTTGEMKPPA